MSKEVKYPVKHQCLRELHHEISGLARLIHWQRAFKDNIYYVFSFVLVCEGQRQKDGGRETETEMFSRMTKCMQICVNEGACNFKLVVNAGTAMKSTCLWEYLTVTDLTVRTFN